MPINVSDLNAQEFAVFETLSVAKQAIYLDLSEPVRRLVGRWAPSDACISAQVQAGACSPDARVTAQVGIRKPIDFDELSPSIRFGERVQPYRLRSARKGHLLLCPGGPSGLIGALLSALTPPQDYSHMGIIVEDDGFDGTFVRHCTTSEDWLNSKLFTTGVIFDKTPLKMDIPEHGFRSDAVKFMWPGTITQSIEIAFKASKPAVYQDEVYEIDDKGEIKDFEDEEGNKVHTISEKFATMDAANGTNDSRATGKAFLIGALGFDGNLIPGTATAAARVVEAVIVQPCIFEESDRVRAALNRVAEASLSLRGHYRLFAYTNARVADAEDGPPCLETVSQPVCRDNELVTDPVKATRGMVCSTFIWEAVRLANTLAKPTILLDGRPGKGEPPPPFTFIEPCVIIYSKLNGCGRKPASDQDPVDPQDGLYFYSSTTRQYAATALQAKLIAKVMDNISTTLDELAGPPLIGALVGGGAGVVIADLIGSNPLVLAVLLGVSTAYIDVQIRILRDTAQHLSNQLGATFQSDNSAEDNESDDWRNNPGTGNTVSPDDTINGWAHPYFESDDEVIGLYGRSRRAEVLSPAMQEGESSLSTWEIWEPLPPPVLTHTNPPPGLGVRVFFNDALNNPVFLAGARVRIGCFEIVTKTLDDMTQPQFCGPLTPGQYYARGGWQDSKGFQWKGPRRVVVVPGPDVDLQVVAPKETRRTVRISGTADLLNRHLLDGVPVVGGDPWRATVSFDTGWFPMGLDLAAVNESDDPDFFAWLKQNFPGEMKGQGQHTYVWQEELENWGIARVTFVCDLLATGEISITATGATKAGDDDAESDDPEPPVLVEPKANNADPPATFTVTVQREGPGFPAKRATLQVQIDNNQQSG